MTNLSDQSVSSLIGEKKPFIDKNGDVDTGVIKSVTVNENGIDKIVIKGEKQCTISPCQMFEDVKDALTAAIKLAEEKKHELEQSISAMRGRIHNI